MRLGLLLLLLTARVACGAPALTQQFLFNVEAGNHWDEVSTATLNAGTLSSLPGIGDWTTNGPAGPYFHITTNTSFRQINNHTIFGVETNAVDLGTRGLAVNYNTPATDLWVVKNLGAEYDEISGYLYVDQNIGNLTDGNTFLWDQVLFETGSFYRVIQRVEGNAANGNLGYQTHSSHASSVGNRIPVPVGRHLISFSISRSAATFKFGVYNADTRAQISTNSSMALDDHGVTTVKFSTDGHGGSLDVTNVWDNLVIITNTSSFPILPWPTNIYYVNATGGDDNNSGRAPAYPWATIGKAATTLVAGDTVYVAAGNYAERVAESADGTVNAPISYIAVGAVTVRGFQITGDYIRMIGFRATHDTDLGYAAFDISNARGCEVIDCVTTNTSRTSVDFIPAGHFTVLRGNSFSWPGYTNGVLRAASKIMQDGNDAGDGSTNILIEYNTMFETGDYINSSGSNWIARNNKLGPTTTAYNSGLPHEDGWQANAMTWNSLYEANWHGPNQTDDSHFFLTQVSAGGFTSSNWTTIFNVSVNSGDALFMEVDTMTRFLMAQNTMAYAGHGPSRNTAAAAIYFQNNSIGNRMDNNIFTNVFTSNASMATTDTGGTVTIGANLTHPNTAGTVDGDPVFVNYTDNDLRIQTTSPAKDTGLALTTANGGSTGTTVTLHGATNAYWFYDTFGGLIRGAKVYVGDDNNLEIASRDLAAGTITLTTSITWSDGDDIGYAYRGTAPDLGAYEFGDTLLTSATISSNSAAFPVYTVTPTGDTRFVVFYADGSPQAPDYDSPYTYTAVGNEVVTAKAYALHPQVTPVVTAGASQPAAPRVWNVTTLNAGTVNAGGSE